MDDSEKRSWPVGYSPTPEAKSLLETSRQTNTLKTVRTAIGDHLGIAFLAATGYLLFNYSPPYTSLPLNFILWACIAGNQRGLENLLHDGSHKNWHRDPRRNDLLVNVLTAWPVFSTVQAYRKNHRPHHLYFGSANDPETLTYAEQRIEDLDRCSRKAYIAGVIVRLPRVALSWWKRIGTSGRTLLPTLTWHIAVYLLPLSALFGTVHAFVIWAGYWLLPLVLFLTPLRFVAESSEHAYRTGSKVFDATITNCGSLQRWFVHPHQDGFHSLHHIQPAIPLNNLRRTHEELAELDPIGYGARVRYRTKVVQHPRQTGHSVASLPAVDHSDLPTDIEVAF